MKALIVIDMQEEYVGRKHNQKRYPYDSEQSIKKIELVGVDGNSCVGFSDLDGIKHSFSIFVSLSCIGIANAERFIATREKRLKANVTIID